MATGAGILRKGTEIVDFKKVTIYGIAAPVAAGIVIGIPIERLGIGPVLGYRHGLVLVLLGCVMLIGGTGQERLHRAPPTSRNNSIPEPHSNSSRFGYEIPDQEASTDYRDYLGPQHQHFAVGSIITGILILAI